MFFVLYKILLCLNLFEFIRFHDAYGQELISSNIRDKDKRQTGNVTIECELPPHPANGQWIVINGFGLPGYLVDEDTEIKFECDPHYKLSSSPKFVCDETWRLKKFPVCEKKCSPKYSTPTTTIRCDDKYGREVPCDNAVDGTFLSYSCIPFFEIPVGHRKTAICVDGQWNFPNPICQPVCGKLIDKSNLKLVYRGAIKNKREYPWIVAIFQKSLSNLAICGGTIVSQNVIITAAHCVTNDFGNALPSEEFIVGVGKYYNKFQDEREGNVQYIDIKRIEVMLGYAAASKRFLADIALLITKDLIVFNEIIGPVCYKDLTRIYIYPGKRGVVAGWGKDETGEQPDELRTLEIPYKYEGTCAEELPKDWALKYYTNDKICTGFFNKSRSVCPGDSGSGLYFENPDDGRYYIHGVVSVGPAINGQCDPQQNSLYTKVASYYHFVDRVVTQERLEPCTLPMLPKNGKWIILGESKTPGDVVSGATVLHIECNSGYKASSSNHSLECQSAKFLPTCELSCPIPSLPEGTIYKCTNNKNIEINCSQAIHGTTLVYSCPKSFRTKDNNTEKCMYGFWERTPECIFNNTKDNSSTYSDETVIDENYVICTYYRWYFAPDLSDSDKYNVTLCTHVIFSYFGLWDEGVEMINNDFNGKGKQLSEIIKKFKQRNKSLKVLLALEGNGVSTYFVFSSAPNTKSKRIRIIFNMLYFIRNFGFDGLTIPWIYHKPMDKMDYIQLLREIREVWNENGFLLSAFFRPYSDNNGYYTKDVFELLDFIIIQNIYGYGPQFPYTGQVSALYASSTENVWEKNRLNINAAAKNLVNSGYPKNKIVLSVSVLTTVFILEDKNEHGVHAPIINTKLPSSESFRPVGYSQVCGYKNFTTVWDDEQKSAYSYYEDKWIGHENEKSVRIKASYVKDNGFLGLNIWPMEEDDVAGNCGPKQGLLKEINRVLRKNITIGD